MRKAVSVLAAALIAATTLFAPTPNVQAEAPSSQQFTVDQIRSMCENCFSVKEPKAGSGEFFLFATGYVDPNTGSLATLSLPPELTNVDVHAEIPDLPIQYIRGNTEQIVGFRWAFLRVDPVSDRKQLVRPTDLTNGLNGPNVLWRPGVDNHIFIRSQTPEKLTLDLPEILGAKFRGYVFTGRAILPFENTSHVEGIMWAFVIAEPES